MKAALRKRIKALLADMPAQQAAARSLLACQRLAACPEYARASAVMLYMPIPCELDPLPLAMAALEAGKTVLMPRVQWEARRLLVLPVRSLDEGFAPGPFGIREPVGGEPWPIERIDLIVVPALAYDRGGGRLGRGGGLYDRFLSQPGRRAVACGLGFDEQVLDELPRMEHDYPVDMLVSDKEVLRFGPTGP